MLRFGIRINVCVGGGGGVVDLGKERKLPVSNILEDKWGNHSTHEENLLVRCSGKQAFFLKRYNFFFLKRGRENYVHARTHTHTRTHARAHTHIHTHTHTRIHPPLK